MKYLSSTLVMALMICLHSCKEKTNESVVYQPIGYSTEERNAQVTKEFGALKVKEGEFTGTTKIIPWSSWWFPLKDRFLFDSDKSNVLAPLQKYDQYVSDNYDHDPESALFEEREIYSPNEVNWAGLCDAWAVASVLYAEPKEKVVRRRITFTVADQKSLLLKMYDNAKGLKLYGDRNNGGYNNDFNDVYADQFHRFVQVFLFEKHLPFLMDYDPSFPVWTVPVYNVKFKISKLDEISAHVKAWVTIATPFVDDANFVGTKKSVKYYEYKLVGRWENDALMVTGSEWLNDSVYDHPDYLIAYPDKVKPGSRNTKLDLDKVREILRPNSIALGPTQN